jgi:small subunit ribosomal protein S5
MGATRGKRRQDRSSESKKGYGTVDWQPKTKLGRMVRKGEIKTISDALKTGLPVREPEIVDLLVPDIEDEVIDVNMV